MLKFLNVVEVQVMFSEKLIILKKVIHDQQGKRPLDLPQMEHYLLDQNNSVTILCSKLTVQWLAVGIVSYWCSAHESRENSDLSSVV